MKGSHRVQVLSQASVILCLLLSAAFNPTPVSAQAGTTRAEALVILNSTSSSYTHFAYYIQLYLDHFGIPYSTWDIATTPLPSNLDTYALLIVGHNSLDPANTYLTPSTQTAIAAAVNSGTGLVNFDTVLADEYNSPLYSYIQDIFSFSYFTASASSTVSINTSPTTGAYIVAAQPPSASYTFDAAITPVGLTPSAQASVLATLGGQPLLIAQPYGQGRAVQWASYAWIDPSAWGFMRGFDDLIWRSLVWAARKPFVLQGMPPFVSLRVDDCDGPFDWIETANSYGVKVWAGLFFSITNDIPRLKSVVDAGGATVSTHARSQNDFFYFDHENITNFSDATIAQNFADASAWHAAADIPISKYVVPHYYELGTNVFSSLQGWGVEYIGTVLVPGTPYGYPSPLQRPFYLYQQACSDCTTTPLYFADYLAIPGHPEFNHSFFNILTEVRGAPAYEWAPDNDVSSTVARGLTHLARSINGMELPVLMTHEYYINAISAANWNAIMSGLTSGLAAFQPEYVTMDYAAQYTRAVFNSSISSSTFNSNTQTLSTTLTGSADLVTRFQLFTGADSNIQRTFVNVPAFSGSTLVNTTVGTPIPNPTVSNVVVPSSGTYTAGQNLNFTVNWSEAVTVNTSGGTPTLSLTIGSTSRSAAYISGSGSAALVFRYTVVTGDLDTNGITVNSPIVLNGSTIRDADNNNAILTLNNVGSTTGVLVDAVAPTVSSVSVPSSGIYGIGQNLNFTVNWSEVVAVNTSGGTPTLNLTIGSTSRSAAYLSGSGTSALIFRYTVATGDLDTDGIIINTLALNGGTIRDAGSNNANLTLNNVGSTTGVLVDAVAPTVSSVSVPANDTYIAGESLSFTVNWSEVVAVNTSGGTPTLNLTIGSTSRSAAYLSGSGTNALIFRYTVLAGDLDTDGITVNTLVLNGGTIRDAGSNNANLTLNNVGSTTGVLVDAVVPTVGSVSVPDNGTYIAGQNLNFTVNWSEAVIVTGSPRVLVNIGGTNRYATFLSGSGSSALIFRYTIQAGDSDSNGIQLGTAIDLNGGTIRDAIGNDAALTLINAGNTTGVLVDAVAPTVNSVTVPSNGTYIAGQILNFTVNWSEAVTVDTTGGTPYISLIIGSTPRNAAYQSGSGTTALLFSYTVQAGDLDTDGIQVNSSIVLNGGTLRDAPGNNANLTLNNIGNPTQVLVDAVVPTVSNVAVPANGSYGIGLNLDFTVNWNEPVVVTNLPRIALDVGGVARYATYQSGSGSAALVFRYTVQAGDSDSNGVQLGATIDLNGGTVNDQAGNSANLTLNNVASTAGVLVETVAPTVTSVSVPASGTYTAGQNLSFTVNWSEAVAVNTSGGTPALNLTIGSTSRSAAYLSGSGTNALIFRYTVLAGDLDTDGITVNTLALNGGTIRDVASNNANLTLNGVPNPTGILIDAAAPIVSNVTVPANGTYIAGQNLEFTVNWSEAVFVTGVPRIALDIGGTDRYVTFLSGSGSSALIFRYTIQAGDSDSNGIQLGTAIDLNGGTIRDAASNNANLTLNNLGSTAGVLVDTVAPTITSVAVPANGTYSAGQNLSFTVNWSEAVNVTGAPTLILTIGSTTRNAAYQSGNGTTALLFSYTVQAGELDTDGITVDALALNGGTLRDAPGNNANLALNGVGSTSLVRVDAVAPAVNNVTVPFGGSYRAGQALAFTVNWSEAVTVNTTSGTPYLTLTIGGSTARNVTYQSGSGTTALLFSYTVQAGDNDSDGIQLDPATIELNGGTIQDAAGNSAALTLHNIGNTADVLVDTTAAVVASVSVPADGTYGAGQSLDLIIHWDEAVIATGSPSIALDIGGVVRYATYQTGSGSTALLFRYTVQLGELDPDGITVTSIALNGGSLRDIAGNDANPVLHEVGNTGAVLVNAAHAPSFTSPEQYGIVPGKMFAFFVTATDVDPGDTVTISASGLPDWLSLTPTGNGTAMLSGTAPTSGVFTVSLHATDSGGRQTDQAFTIKISSLYYMPQIYK